MDVYTMTIELLSGRFYSPWKRIVEVKADTTLFDIHDFIQHTIKFEEDHLFEFFTGRNQRNKKRVFAYGENYYRDKQLESLEIPLSENFPLGRLKLYYFFDFGDSWIFRISKGRQRKTVEPRVKYPRIIESKGKNPKQYPDWD
jgi:hypothetical protein